MSDKDISNSSLLDRMSVEGWIALLLVIISGVASHTTLANDQSTTAKKVAAIESKQAEVQKSVQGIQTDVAIIKNDLKHLEQQREDIRAIRKLLEKQQ